jgi:hypothetical protein
MESMELVKNIIEVLNGEVTEIRMFQLEGSKHSCEIWVEDHLVDLIMEVNVETKEDKISWDDNRYFTEKSSTFKIEITEGTYYNQYGDDITSLDNITDASNYSDLTKKLREMIMEEIEKDPSGYYESNNY